MEPVIVTFGKEISADVIKLRTWTWKNYPGLFRWAPKVITSVLIRRGRGPLN